MAGELRPAHQYAGGYGICGGDYADDRRLRGMKKRSYEDMTHIYGRIWILSALGMIFAYPIITCIYYNAWPG